MGFNSDVTSVISIENAKYIKDFCAERVEKRGLSVSGSCRGCPYRDRSNSKTACCIFGECPYSWDLQGKDVKSNNEIKVEEGITLPVGAKLEGEVIYG